MWSKIICPTKLFKSKLIQYYCIRLSSTNKQTRKWRKLWQLFCLNVFFPFQKQRSETAFKWTVQRDFRPLDCSSFRPAWPTDQWVWLSFRRVFQILNFSGYHTALNQSPRSMVLRWITLPAVSYWCDLSGSYLKGQSNKIFDLFFS